MSDSLAFLPRENCLDYRTACTCTEKIVCVVPHLVSVGTKDFSPRLEADRGVLNGKQPTPTYALGLRPFDFIYALQGHNSGSTGRTAQLSDATCPFEQLALQSGKYS